MILSQQDEPADTSALDSNRNFTRLQRRTLMNLLEFRLSFRDPEIMIGVCPDADVGLGWLHFGGRFAHCDCS